MMRAGSPSKSLALLFRMLHPHRGRMALGLGLSCLAILFAIGLLSLSGWFITAAAVAGLSPASALLFNFFFPSIGVRILAVLRTLGRYAERLILHDVTFRILQSLRLWFYGCIEPLAPDALLGHRSGDLLNRMVADIDLLDNFFVRVLIPSLTFVISVGAVTLFLWRFDPTTALLAALFITLMGTGLSLFSRALTGPSGRQIPGRLTDLRNTALDTVNGMATWQVFDAVSPQLTRMQKADQELIANQRRLIGRQSMVNGLGTFLSGICIVAVLCLGLSMAHRALLSAPVVALILLTVMATLELLGPLPGAYQFWGQIQKAGQRLTEFSDLPPSVRFPTADDQRPLPDSTVVYRQVRFAYPGNPRPVLDGIDLRLAAGEKLGLMGSSGCGKTTLAHLLVRFWDPDQGTITVGGMDLKTLGESQLRQTVTLISQNAHLFSGTLRDNLLLANPTATEAQLQAALENARLSEFVRQLPRGMDTWVGEQGHLLSGGQARRLVLARAILHDAPIWILDEPTEGLDVNTQAALMEAFLRAARKRSVLLISHRAAVLSTMDRVVTIQNGKLEPV